jgi:hypothetical protein
MTYPGKFFSVSFSGLTSAAAIDLLSVTIPAGRVYLLHEIRIGQSTDAGDAEAELYLYQITRHRTLSVSGSGGSPVSPIHWSGRRREQSVPVDWTYGDTTQIASASPEILSLTPENNQAPYLFIPPVNNMPEFIAGDTLVVSLESTPVDSVTFAGTLIFSDAPLTVGA